MSGTHTAVVILSTGRTGTMFFADLLRSLFPQAEVYHEAGHSRLMNVLTNIHLSGFLPRSALRFAWRRLIEPGMKACQKSYYIDSNNHLYGLIPLEARLYSNLKVVHIVRDPRSYVRSHLNWARHRPKSFIANYLVPFWQPNPFLLKERSLLGWLRMSTFERFCWIWDFKNRLIGSLEQSDTDYLWARFEDFFESSEPRPHLDRLLHFIGSPAVEGVQGNFHERVNPAKGRSFPPWQEWAPRQCQQLDAICGTTMARYGYGQEAEWSERLGGRRSGA